MTFDLSRHDTICALATPPGAGAIAVVRVSGTQADAIREAVFRPRRGRQRPFVATLGDVVEPTDGALLDEALCTAFPAGRSYTGEASFELSVHGGASRARSVLRALVAAGARPAGPGEFTLRAVLTGRLDLTAAEAVHDVVSARSDRAARAALQALSGELGRRLRGARDGLLDVLAELEARLDFPDEDLDPAARAAQQRRLGAVMDTLERLTRGAALGRRLTEGARVVLSGPPNAGKSTLFNALVGEERALVHHAPGTTRDVLEAEAIFGGVPCIVVDVAGLRGDEEASDVERLGIERARAERGGADVLLDVRAVDALCGAEPRAWTAGEDTGPGAVLPVITKRDLGGPTPPAGAVFVSARTGEGIDELRARIARLVDDDDIAGDEPVLTRARQREDVAAALSATAEASAALGAGHADEVVCAELRRAGAALDRCLGTALDADVLDRIFSRFCIGK